MMYNQKLEAEFRKSAQVGGRRRPPERLRFPLTSIDPWKNKSYL